MHNNTNKSSKSSRVSWNLVNFVKPGLYAAHFCGEDKQPAQASGFPGPPKAPGPHVSAYFRKQMLSSMIWPLVHTQALHH